VGIFVLVAAIVLAMSLHRRKQEPRPSDLSELRSKAEKGDAEAQYNLGRMSEDGNGGAAEDIAEADRWYRKAGEQGNLKAQKRLGLSYYEGSVLCRDAKWCRKAADQSDADAECALGRLFRDGDPYHGIAKDSSEAMRWYLKAGEQGQMEAQAQLGFFYHRRGSQEWGAVPKGPNGRPADPPKAAEHEWAEAVKWFLKAGEQGDEFSECLLGNFYCEGLRAFKAEGVPKSMSEAAKWYRRAAEKGNNTAQMMLGEMYAEGNGVQQDYVEAYKWLNLAGQDDLSFSLTTYISPAEKRRELERRMLPEQIAEAQRLAREFKPRKAPNRRPFASGDNIAESSPSASGTGFFITEEGFLVTNEHVVRDATQFRLVTSAGSIPARVVKVDAANDLALLKAEGRFAALPVTTSRAAHLGNTVIMVGFPNIGLQGFAPKFARGEIAALSGAMDDAKYFQISVPVQPGNSGGALVDERGNVVGVVSAKLSARAALAASGVLPENVNYAVKGSFLLGFLESVPEVSAKLKEPNTKEQKFEDVVRSAEQAAVLVLVY
jgi:TPR repeat protein/S1-C subfamily serine protease